MRRMILGALLALAACGKPQPTERATGTAKAANPAQPPAARGNRAITQAMEQVPQSEAAMFQRALACEVKRNAAKKRPALTITPEYLTDLHARLRRNHRLASC